MSGAQLCDINADCKNTAGSYECRCKEGFEGDGVEICAVSNECFVGEHNCDMNAKCIDKDYLYDCQCSAGYKGKRIKSNDNLSNSH